LGVAGAGALIIASAMFGIFTACIVGNPLATALIRRFRLATPKEAPPPSSSPSSAAEEEFWALSPTVEPVDEKEARRAAKEGELTGGVLLHNLLLILAVMGVGALISLAIRHPNFTLPDYIGAMVCAAVVRNVDDRAGWFRVNARAVEALSGVALALFLVLALMSLELWKVAGLALPMLVILGVQVVVMILYAVAVTFVLMGRDYEAAVTAGGHVGFGLGITANAVANMEALSARYGPAPRSFLVVPIVGAFFIDFSNSLVISIFAGFAR
ncbi:MAG: sodium/glutamate symporter, partial [Acidobacteriota bacterium]|nr:sodium/glutamate symporter [Acidobacteriota bacterium]